MEDRGNLDPAPPARRAAAPAAAAAEAGLGGPGPARCPARRHTESAAPGTAAADYPGHDPALAPRHRPPPLGRPVRARQDRPAGNPAEHQGPGPSAGPREPRLGIPEDPRRDGWPGRQGRSINRLEILKASGIGPARQSGPTWSQFLRSQAEAILACDFFTADLLDGTQAYVLAVIEHATRRIRILGVTLHPTGQWTAQQARNLLMDLGEQAEQVKFMIRDRGSNFTARSTPSSPMRASGPCCATCGRHA